jgi:hypothetical protein
VAYPYASAEQLASALRVQVTPKNQAQLEACVMAASIEIDSDLGRHPDAPLPDPTPADIEQTCIARATEWWKSSDAAYGVVGFADTGALRAPSDSFARHSATLIHYKQTFGIA